MTVTPRLQALRLWLLLSALLLAFAGCAEGNVNDQEIPDDDDTALMGSIRSVPPELRVFG